ncbi:MAG: catalase [Burkholderiales bacterium]|nr:catalase [Burkholderiales bacterium]
MADFALVSPSRNDVAWNRREGGTVSAGAEQPAASADGRQQAGSAVTLSEQAQAIVDQLKARDSQVRAHEQAHLAASGGLAGGASYVYQKGPDGVSYAIGGEVSIDVSAGRNPADTIRRAQIIQAAALAPADPSGQDFAVAAQARQMEQQARTALLLERLKASYGTAGTAAPAAGGARIDSYA